MSESLGFKSNEFLKKLMQDLKLTGLEKLQSDGMYVTPSDDLTQEEIENLFETTDWEEGITAYVGQIATYLKVELSGENKIYLNYIEGK